MSKNKPRSEKFERRLKTRRGVLGDSYVDLRWRLVPQDRAVMSGFGWRKVAGKPRLAA
jgi:hypothetical protein